MLASFRTGLKSWMHEPPKNHPKRVDLRSLRLKGSHLTAESINQALSVAYAQHFPVVSKPKENEAVLRPITHLWQLWRSFKQIQREGDDLRCCFQVWRAFQSFKKQKKVVQRAGRDSRKSKVDNLLNEAAGAAARQDMRGLYQVVRKLAPKPREFRFTARMARSSHQARKFQSECLQWGYLHHGI